MSSGDSVSEEQLVFCGTETFLFRERGGMRKNMAAKHMAMLRYAPL